MRSKWLCFGVITAFICSAGYIGVTTILSNSYYPNLVFQLRTRSRITEYVEHHNQMREVTSPRARGQNLTEPDARCCNITSPLMPGKPPWTQIPKGLLPMFQTNVRKRISGYCFILLGDSTLGEAAEDLGVILGPSGGRSAKEFFTPWIKSTTAVGKPWHRAPKETHIDWGTFNASYFPNMRNFTLVSRDRRVVVYHRFIGHTRVMGDRMGLRSLLSGELRGEILNNSAEKCGKLRRVLWLESGYHEYLKNLKTNFTRSHWPPIYQEVFTWVERLAPFRFWLSRHSTIGERTHPLGELSDWVSRALSNRLGWTYVDYRDAWSCDAHAAEDIPLHTGALAGFYYCCLYLSMLRTMLALQHTLVETSHSATDSSLPGF